MINHQQILQGLIDLDSIIGHKFPNNQSEIYQTFFKSPVRKKQQKKQGLHKNQTTTPHHPKPHPRGVAGMTQLELISKND